MRRRRASFPKQKHFSRSAFVLEAPPRFELGREGFADPCLTAWLWRRICRKASTRDAFLWSGLRGSNPLPQPWQGCALPDELNPHIRQQILVAGWCLRSESNQRHKDFQSSALPTELQRHTVMATRMGLEPTTSAVTGRRSNQLSYQAITLLWLHKQLVGTTGLEPMTLCL